MRKLRRKDGPSRREARPCMTEVLDPRAAPAELTSATTTAPTRYGLIQARRRERREGKEERPSHTAPRPAVARRYGNRGKRQRYQDWRTDGRKPALRFLRFARQSPPV